MEHPTSPAAPGAPDPHLHRDILHSLGVAALACVLSGGLLYLAYLARTVWVAWRSPHADPDGDYLLVFGKALANGEPDAQYRRRLDHALRLSRASGRRPLVLLGGGPAGLTEAEVGARVLREAGLPEAVEVWLEDASLDTLQNLRHARELMRARAASGRVVLLSNRYHLARCACLAGQLGFDYRTCAAEPAFRLGEQPPWRLLAEAGYLCWLDIGTRWARLIGHRRMLARVS